MIIQRAINNPKFTTRKIEISFMHLKKILALSILCCLVVIMVLAASQDKDEKKLFHTTKELANFNKAASGPIGPGDYFTTSVRCKGCHGYDTLMFANVDANGVDINLYDDWQSTMMANSAKDPFWRAKVSHEILVNPGHTLELQDKCTSCHAPMGNYNSKYKGLAAHYTIGTMLGDSLGLDGVSCAGCHTIADSSILGSLFSGTIPFDTARHIYGPFTNPMAGPMQLYEGYLPTYSDHMNQSKMCSPCHTLITNSVDLAGNYTGLTFVEQATYQEWLNSTFPGDNITCQKCHMPQVTTGVVIANENQALPYRSPYSQHYFVGGNSFMVKILKQNKSQLGINIADRYFDSTIIATNYLLKQKTLGVTLLSDSVTIDTAYFKVRLVNKAGHKFPSGYPSRRAVMQFIVKDANGDTVFKSGIFNPDYTVSGENSSFEPHRNYIRQNNQTQLYEMVMGDVNSQFTTLLERATILLKDNRIPPEGFTNSHLSYDTTKISLDAINDPDFNKLNTTEGTGRDFVHFNVPVTGIMGTLTATIKVYYQAVPPKWLNEMFGNSSAEIDTFKAMYHASDKLPVLIGGDSLGNVALLTGLTQQKEAEIKIWPTMSSNGRVYVKTTGGFMVTAIEAYSSDGKIVYAETDDFSASYFFFDLPEKQGIYFIRLKIGGKIIFKKVFKQ